VEYIHNISSKLNTYRLIKPHFVTQGLDLFNRGMWTKHDNGRISRDEMNQKKANGQNQEKSRNQR